MVAIPWRVGLALQADGWYLRRDIVWAKPNPTPESPADRPVQAYEHILLLSRRKSRYFYDVDAPREEGAEDRMLTRDVWTFASRPRSPGNGEVEHFAAFPEDLPRACIRLATPEAACSSCGTPLRRVADRRRVYEGDETARAATSRSQHQLFGAGDDGANPEDRRYRIVVRTRGWRRSCDCGVSLCPAVVLDPFCGAGTTGEVAVQLGRSFVGLDVVVPHVELSRQRIAAAWRRAVEAHRQLELFDGTGVLA